MHTFHFISKKIIDIDNCKDYKHIFNNIYTITFFIFIQKTYSIQDKFKFLNETISNIFHTAEMKEQFFDYFNRIQKIYYAFSKFAFVYKYKKAKIMVNTDLIMNEIKENDKYIYCLFQNNCKYLFNIHELVKIIHNSIGNSYHLFSNPTPVKNPYNNIILNKSTLYNIYFFIREKTILQPELFYYFFKTNFNLKHFVQKYQYILRNFSLKNYFKNSTKKTICDNIDCMIEQYNLHIKYRKFQIIIDDTFPKDVLINIMSPYLELFLISQYSLLYNDRINAKKTLEKKLYEFNKYNPLFSRKIYEKRLSSTMNNRIEIVQKFEHNKIHIPFYESENMKDRNNFMTNHMENIDNLRQVEQDNDDGDDDNDDDTDDNDTDDDDTDDDDDEHRNNHDEEQ